MKYLIVGLGNIGIEYQNTRHNIGFKILDALAKASKIVFEDKRYGSITQYRIKGQTAILLKPSTYMNLSGNAVRYWMQQEKIPLERVLIVVDDLALSLGCLRLKSQGSDAGHNGLKHIAQILGTQTYNRLRIGIGNEFPHGTQVDFVLSQFLPEEDAAWNERIPIAIEAINAYILSGMAFAMNHFNGK